MVVEGGMKQRPAAQMDHASSGAARKKALHGERKLTAERADRPPLTTSQVLRKAALDMATRPDENLREFWQALASWLEEHASLAERTLTEYPDPDRGWDYNSIVIAKKYLGMAK